MHIIPDLTDIDGNNAFKHARFVFTAGYFQYSAFLTYQPPSHRKSSESDQTIEFPRILGSPISPATSEFLIYFDFPPIIYVFMPSISITNVLPSIFFLLPSISLYHSSGVHTRSTFLVIDATNIGKNSFFGLFSEKVICMNGRLRSYR